MQIIFSDKEAVRNERDKLLAECQKYLLKIERLNGRYGGKIRRARKRLAELDRQLGE